MERTLQIQNKLGLHARPAALLVETASRFDADVQVIKSGNSINAKSIMGVLMLAAEQGSSLTFRARGPQETQVLDAIEKLLNDKFHEE
ncbi:HPr family phosphocarrier protein [bacterium]|nr:HPr family phosphocarrier protein [bacterium]